MTGLPPWPGPITSDSPWSEVEARLDHYMAERRARAWKRREGQLRIGLDQAKRGGTETGAPCAGDEEKPSDAGQQE